MRPYECVSVAAFRHMRQYESIFRRMVYFVEVARTNIPAVFRSLADLTRLRLLNLLSGGEVCVCYLVDTLEEPQPKVSQHLAYLRRVEIVESRRDGKWMHYKLTEPKDEEMSRILGDTLRWISSDPVMQRDMKRLVKICIGAKAPMSKERVAGAKTC